MGHTIMINLTMIKKLIFILLFLPLTSCGQLNFFWSHTGKLPCILKDFVVQNEADISSNVTTPHGLYFKPDGTRMFVIDYVDKEIVEYAINEAWNLDSLQYANSETLNDNNGEYTSLYWKPDGSKYYVANGNTNRVEEYTVTFDWLTPATLTDSISAGTNFDLVNLCFSKNGDKIIMGGWETSLADTFSYREFGLTTAWDLSTGIEGSTFADAFLSSTIHYETRLHKTETALFFILQGQIYQYNLLPVEVETLAYQCKESDIYLDNFDPFGLYIKSDYRTIYVTDTYDDTVKEIRIGVEL
jgi:DNA-binding beta-propeller fold protein YncE